MDFSGHKWGLKFGRPGRVSNKRFKYVPRYYNPEKDELNQRVEAARRERDLMENPELAADGNHAERMRRAMEFRTNSFNSVHNSMNRFFLLRTAIIAVILFIIFYLLFSSEVILRIFDAFYHE